eukprot:scaffold211115_cov27-Tisochrysis_lutea.AAC.3
MSAVSLTSASMRARASALASIAIMALFRCASSPSRAASSAASARRVAVNVSLAAASAATLAASALRRRLSS